MYEDKTPEAIKQSIIAALRSDLDTREGSFVDDMLGPMAVELYKLYDSLNAVRSMVWVDETSGQYLDLAAEDLGLEPRKAGTRARVLLHITGSSGYTVPKGTRFLTADGLSFDTLHAQSIPSDNVAEIEAEAAEPGSAYNVWADEIRFQFENAAHLTAVTNPAAAAGGADEESDAALFARIVLARQKPRTSGNIHDYEAWALESAGVGAVRVFPLWDGPGTVKVLVADEQKRPVDDSIVRQCADHIEEVRPIGPAVTVVSVEAVPVDIFATVRLTANADAGAVREAFVQSLTGYLAGFAMEQAELRVNHIAALLIMVDGVQDYDGLLINDRSANLQLAEEQVPVMGEVELQCV